VAGKTKGNPNVGPVAVLVVGALALLGLFGYGFYQSEQASKQQASAQEMLKPNEFGCTGSPVQTAPAGVVKTPCKSANHVADGTQVTYQTDPPTSGEHYSRWVNPGFYGKAQTPELLVHNLEHGHVVLYYNTAKLSQEQLAAVKAAAEKFKGNWDGVVAVPRENGPALILTAWEHSLTLETFDQAKMDVFVDTFRGRGPENPVRL
jgi:hypothetical protein